MDACNSDCKTCPIKCPVSTLESIIDNSKPISKEDEKKVMDEIKTQGCGASKDPIIVDLQNKVNFLKEKVDNIGKPTAVSYGLKTIITACLITGIAGLIMGMIAYTKISNIEVLANTANENVLNAVKLADLAKSRADANYVYLRQLKSRSNKE